MYSSTSLNAEIYFGETSPKRTHQTSHVTRQQHEIQVHVHLP